MTNDNERSEANNEQHADPVYGPEPAPAAPQAPVSAPAAAAAPVPVVERSRWRPSRSIATIAGAAVGAVLLFGSGVAVGHAVDRHHDEHRPTFMRQAGSRDAQDGRRLQPRNDQMRPRDGGQVQPRNDRTPPRQGRATPQVTPGGN